MRTWCVLVGSVSLVVLMAASVRADLMNVYSTPAYDGAVQVGGSSVWDAQNLFAGDEEHWLDCLTAGVIKFQLPSLPANTRINAVWLVLHGDGRADGTSLGAREGDANYPSGPFFQLQHYTFDNTGVLSSSDGSEARVENVGAVATASGWAVTALDVTAAVRADIAAGYTYTGYRTLATDYTGRILTPADLTEFNGYLAAFFGTSAEYSPSNPYLEVDVSPVPEPATLAILALGGIWLGRRKNSR